MLIHIFGFADQNKITYRLGYNLILKRDKNDKFVVRENLITAGKDVINDLSWFVDTYIKSR